VTVRPCCPSWSTVKESPATVETPTLSDAEVFAATEYVSVPFPVPLPPDVMDIQDAPLVAVQAHPVWVVTAMVPDDNPVALTETPAGEME
jgi:hypothetical protein